MMTNTNQRLTQGQFSFLPDLHGRADQQADPVRAQTGLGAVGLEYTDDPHPRNTYWEMWGMPMFDIHDAAGILFEVNALP